MNLIKYLKLSGRTFFLPLYLINSMHTFELLKWDNLNYYFNDVYKILSIKRFLRNDIKSNVDVIKLVHFLLCFWIYRMAIKHSRFPLFIISRWLRKRAKFSSKFFCFVHEENKIQYYLFNIFIVHVQARNYSRSIKTYGTCEKMYHRRQQQKKLSINRKFILLRILCLHLSAHPFRPTPHSIFIQDTKCALQ